MSDQQVDMNEVTKLRDELERQRRRLGAMFEVALEGIVVLDPDFTILEANTAFKSLVGLGPIDLSDGMSFCNYVVSDDLRKVKNAVSQCCETGDPICNLRLSMSNGTEAVPCVMNASLFRFNSDTPKILAFITDITDCERAEKEMIRRETLAVAGTLAAGVAHEYNNINAVIKGHLDLILLQSSAVSGQVREQLEIVRRQVRRGIEITNNLLVFTKDTDGGFSCVGLAHLVGECMALLAGELRSAGVKCVCDVPSDIELHANPSQICQVLMNLFLNARDAMMSSEEKVLTVVAKKDGDRVVIDVSDTGCGIDEANVGRFFDPFFTTKGEKAKSGSPEALLRGTGLGLSVCHTIVEKNHGGGIEVETRHGGGARFRIRLPLCRSDSKVESESRVFGLRSGNGKRVLVLDDEHEVVNLLCRPLRALGYEVVESVESDPVVAENRIKPFDVAIVDLRLKGEVGSDVIERLRVDNSKLKTLVVTGYVGTIDQEQIDRVADKFLTKPFEMNELLDWVGRLAFAEEGFGGKTT